MLPENAPHRIPTAFRTAPIYGSHYLNVREYLVTNGLSQASITPSAQDLTDISNDTPPTDLRYDWLHPNAAGYTVIAKYVNQNISLLQNQNLSSGTTVVTTQGFKQFLSSTADFGNFINVSPNGGFAQGGSTILYASTTNNSLAVGANSAASWMAASSSIFTNLAIGPGALATAPTGNARSNVAVGFYALNANVTGQYNTALGFRALIDNTTGSTNTGIGDGALFQNSTGIQNTAVGANSMSYGTISSYNAAFGFNALDLNITGTGNVAVGNSALQNNLSATNTVAIGYQAGFGGTGAASQQNIFIGVTAGKLNTTGGNNVLLGFQSGENLTSGSQNILVGSSPNSSSYGQVTTGSNNISIGYNIAIASSTLSNQLDIGNFLYGTGLSGTSKTISPGMIGIGTSTPYSRLTVWGSDTASSTSAFSVVNNASTTEFQVFDGGNAQLAGTLTQNSDQRLKTNVQSLDASSSLAAIDALNPITFNWIDSTEGTTPQLGFIAQQVQQLFPALISTTSPTPLTPGGTLGLNYIGLISPIVSAIQALSTEVASLETTVAGFAHSFVSDSITANNRLCVRNSNGTPICITGDQLTSLLAGQPSVQVSSPTPIVISGTSTPPSIDIQGSNPATINVGDTYTDLGAIVTDNQGHDLGYKTFLDGALVSDIIIDTTQVATDTIDYVATDTWGNTSTSTRTVIIEPVSPSTPAQ